VAPAYVPVEDVSCGVEEAVSAVQEESAKEIARPTERRQETYGLPNAH
jgi:hypothetical protein